MEVDYYSKYLKYKNKYTELKKQMGGAVIKGVKCSDKSYPICTVKPGCHWDYRIGEKSKGKCKENSCPTNDFGIKRGQVDCTATIGCTWDSDKERCNVKS